MNFFIKLLIKIIFCLFYYINNYYISIISKSAQLHNQPHDSLWAIQLCICFTCMMYSFLLNIVTSNIHLFLSDIFLPSYIVSSTDCQGWI